MKLKMEFNVLTPNLFLQIIDIYRNSFPEGHNIRLSVQTRFCHPTVTDNIVHGEVFPTEQVKRRYKSGEAPIYDLVLPKVMRGKQYIMAKLNTEWEELARADNDLRFKQ